MPSTTPDNIIYLYMGLAASFGLMALFVASLVIRFNSLQKDIQVIEHLREDA